MGAHLLSSIRGPSLIDSDSWVKMLIRDGTQRATPIVAGATGLRERVCNGGIAARLLGQ
jgi:hypothetical protein